MKTKSKIVAFLTLAFTLFSGGFFFGQTFDFQLTWDDPNTVDDQVVKEYTHFMP